MASREMANRPIIRDVNTYFLRGLHANLDLWLQQTTVLDDAKIKSLNPDFPNLFQAVEMGLVLPETHEKTVALMLQCFFWIEASGYGHLWMPQVERALRTLPVVETRQRFRLLKQMGQFQRLQWHLEEAITTFQSANALAQNLRDDRAMAEIQLNLGQVYYLQRAYNQAQDHSQEALRLLTRDHSRLKILTLQNLGQIAQELGDLVQAETLYRQALDVSNQFQSPVDIARTTSLLATLLQQKGESKKALALYDSILNQLRQTANVRDRVELYLNVGSLYYNQNQLAQAEEAFFHAQQLSSHSPTLIFHQALACNNLGCIYREREDWIVSDSYLRKSVTLFQQLGDELMLATALGNWAQLHLRQGLITDALPLIQETLYLSSCYPANTWAQKLHQQYSEIMANLV